MTDRKQQSNPGPRGNRPPGKMPEKKPRFSIYWIYAIIALGFILVQWIYSGTPVKEISWNKIENELIRNHDIKKIVVINHDLAEIYLKKEAIKSGRYKDIKGNGTGSFGKETAQYSFTSPPKRSFIKSWRKLLTSSDTKKRIVLM